jgi:hypothetical protein
MTKTIAAIVLVIRGHPNRMTKTIAAIVLVIRGHPIRMTKTIAKNYFLLIKLKNKI